MADRTILQVPVGASESSVVEMADGGRLYRKQLVKFGSYVYPNDKTKRMVLDKSWGERIAENFRNKVLNKIPVVDGHPKDVQDSASLLAKTRGWLQGLSVEEDGLYGELEIKVADTAAGIDKNLIDDVSVSYDPDYIDKSSGAPVGPALLHIGLVNDPYLKGMKPFQALSDNVNVIMLSESKESYMSKIKNEREFPVQIEYQDGDTVKSVTIAPGEEVEVPDAVAVEVQAQVTDATAPEVKEPTDEEKAAQAATEKEAADKAAADKVAADKVAADAAAAEKADEGKTELEKANAELADVRQQLALRDAESQYSTLLSDGKIVPAQKDAFMSLSTAATSGTISLADGATTSLNDLLTDLFKSAPKRINFGEEGAAGDEAEKTPWDELSAEEQAANAVLEVTPEQYNEVNGTAKSTKKEAK